MIATGRSTGEVFRLQALDANGLPVPIGAPDGLVLQPLKQAVKVGAGKVEEELGGQAVTGYCLDFAKVVPAAGTMYRLADQAMQEQFAPLARVLKAGRQLADAGMLHPDSDAAAYASSIKQWAVWSKVEHWDRADFEKHFVERTRKNAENVKQPWSGDLERIVRGAVANRWQDINAVWAEADRVAASADAPVSVR